MSTSKSHTCIHQMCDVVICSILEMSTSNSHMYTANVWCCNMFEYSRCLLQSQHMCTANVWCCTMFQYNRCLPKSHMYTANVWCCNMLNIIDVYFKVTHVYSKCVIL